MPSLLIDGLNLGLAHGTGIATYARNLARVAADLGYEVGIVYGTPAKPPADPLMREIMFFDAPRAGPAPALSRLTAHVADQIAMIRPLRPAKIPITGAVRCRQFAARCPEGTTAFAARNLFNNARTHFALFRRFPEISLERAVDIFHATYAIPLRMAGNTANIYTIHDLVPLRLPFATLDDKRYFLRLAREIVRRADHIVTVSEHSRRDIVTILGAEEAKVTNTYQAVDLPPSCRDKSDDEVARDIEGGFGLGMREYLLFFGAVEPKKNLGRLIDAFLAARLDLPLVIVAARTWQSEAETRLLQDERFRYFIRDGAEIRLRKRIYALEHVPQPTLVSLVRGARAVLLPSLYEGFGLPVLEAMLLGTPVIASKEAAVPEVAGDAALLVDPYDTDDIKRAIVAIASDDGLWSALRERGLARSARFSMAAYRERVGEVYARVLAGR